MSKEQSFVLFSYHIARVVHSFSMEQDWKGFQSYAARKVVFKNIVSLLSGMPRKVTIFCVLTQKNWWAEKAKTYGQTDKLTNVKTFF